jgi:hypothetical protein
MTLIGQEKTLMIFAYITLSFLVALLGRKSPLGFMRLLLLSLFLTPFFTLLYVLVMLPTPDRRDRR